VARVQNVIREKEELNFLSLDAIKSHTFCDSYDVPLMMTIESAYVSILRAPTGIPGVVVRDISLGIPGDTSVMIEQLIYEGSSLFSMHSASKVAMIRDVFSQFQFELENEVDDCDEDDVKSWKPEKVENFFKEQSLPSIAKYFSSENVDGKCLLDVLKRSHLEEYRETSPEHFSSLAIDRAMSLIQDLRGTFK
jgi:hypothetical protein